MSESIPSGTVVEVTDRGSNKFQYASVVDQPADQYVPNDEDTFVWVRADNGSVFPVSDWLVRVVPVEQVVARLNGHY